MKFYKTRHMRKELLTAVALFAAAGMIAKGQQFYTSTPTPTEIVTQDEDGGPTFTKLPFLVNVSVREGFDDNVFASHNNRISSFFTNIGAGLSYDLVTPQFKLSTVAGGGMTYYYSRPGEKVDLTGNLGLTAKYLATPRLEFDLASYTAYISQPDQNIEGTAPGRDGDYFYSSNTFKARYQWTPKFSTVTSYKFTTYVYTNSDLNKGLGRIEQTLGNSFEYLLLPKTTIVGEYRINPVTYFDADMNSLGNFFLAGVDQVFNPRLSWHARAGVEWRVVNNQTDGRYQYVGPYGQSRLVYRFGPASNLSWLMRYGTEGSGVVGVSQRQTFRSTFGINHALTSRITATAQLGYSNNYYNQPGYIGNYYQNIFDASLGLNYAINRVFSVSAGYTFTGVFSDNENTEYNRNVVFLGANVNF